MEKVRPEYLPLSFDISPNEPEGVATTFLIGPDSDSERLEICGLATYNAPGECEILRVSSGRSEAAHNVGPIDAAAYNPFYPDVDAVQEDGAPRFCRAPWGIITKMTPATLTFVGSRPLRGTFYCRRVLAGKALVDGVEHWKHDREFVRFVERAFEAELPSAALELMYYGWLGRARMGV